MSLETKQPEAGDDRHKGIDFSAARLHEMWGTPSELDFIDVPDDARELEKNHATTPGHLGRTAMRVPHYIDGLYLG